MSFHIPIAFDVAMILVCSLFCAFVFLIRGATFNRKADGIAMGMCVCAALVAVWPFWEQLIRLHFAPSWLNAVADWFLIASVALYWYELRPISRERRLRL